jgi:conjugal transfer mating pair stabilization protein TraG
MFGSRMLNASRRSEFGWLNTQTDTLNYLRSCIFPEGGRDDTAGQTERSTNLMASYSDPNPALFGTYRGEGGELIVAPCPEVWAKISPKILGDGDDNLERLAARMFPGQPLDVALPKVENALLAMYGKAALADAATMAQDIMVQNILINATADAAALHGASLDDPGILMFASMRSQAVAQTNASFVTQGRVAEESLPVLRNITEAILYAMFPVVCILAVASEGQALAMVAKGYLYTMIWIELWPPMFAIVNYLQTLHAASNLSGAGMMADGASGLSMYTATGIYSTSVSDVAVAAWMVTFVPILAAGIVFGMHRLVSIAGPQVYGAGAAASAASAATGGNMTMGSVSFGQQRLTEYRSDVAVREVQGIGGTTSRHLLTGEGVDQWAQSSGPVSLKDVSSWGQRLSEAKSDAIEAAERSSKAFEKSVDAAYQSAIGLAKSGSTSSSSTFALEAGKLGAEGISASDVREEAKRISDKFGIQDQSAVRKALEISLNSPTVGGAGGVPSALAQAVSRIGGVRGGTSEQEMLATTIDQSSDALRQLGTQRKFDLVDQFRQSEGFRAEQSSNISATDRIESSFREAHTFRTQTSADLAEVQRLQHAQEKFAAFQRSGEANWSNEFYDYARARGVDPTQGRASTEQLRRLLIKFAMTGEVFRRDNGELFWVPERGQGPNIIQGKLDEIDARSMSSRHDLSQPGGGADTVRAAGSAFSRRANAAQADVGISAAQPVSDSGLARRVAQGQSQAASAIGAATESTTAATGREQLRLNDRAGNVSSHHAPVFRENPITGERNANKALEGSYERNRGQPFKEEASKVERAEEAKRAADSASLDAVKNTPIPK